MATHPQAWRRITFVGKVYIGLVVMLGGFVLVAGAATPSSNNIAEFLCYLLIAFLASRFTVNLPEIADTMSVNFLFVLIGIIELSFSEKPMVGRGASMSRRASHGFLDASRPAAHRGGQ